MTHHYIAIGNALSCVTVDDHNRCAELPPGLSRWLWRPWPDLLRHLERYGEVQHGEMTEDCLTRLSQPHGRNT